MNKISLPLALSALLTLGGCDNKDQTVTQNQPNIPVDSRPSEPLHAYSRELRCYYLKGQIRGKIKCLYAYNSGLATDRLPDWGYCTNGERVQYDFMSYECKDSKETN